MVRVNNSTAADEMSQTDMEESDSQTVNSQQSSTEEDDEAEDESSNSETEEENEESSEEEDEEGGDEESEADYEQEEETQEYEVNQEDHYEDLLYDEETDDNAFEAGFGDEETGLMVYDGYEGTERYRDPGAMDDDYGEGENHYSNPYYEGVAPPIDLDEEGSFEDEPDPEEEELEMMKKQLQNRSVQLYVVITCCCFWFVLFLIMMGLLIAGGDANDANPRTTDAAFVNPTLAPVLSPPQDGSLAPSTLFSPDGNPNTGEGASGGNQTDSPTGDFHDGGDQESSADAGSTPSPGASPSEPTDDPDASTPPPGTPPSGDSGTDSSPSEGPTTEGSDGLNPSPTEDDLSEDLGSSPSPTNTAPPDDGANPPPIDSSPSEDPGLAPSPTDDKSPAGDLGPSPTDSSVSPSPDSSLQDTPVPVAVPSNTSTPSPTIGRCTEGICGLFADCWELDGGGVECECNDGTKVDFGEDCPLESVRCKQESVLDFDLKRCVCPAEFPLEDRWGFCHIAGSTCGETPCKGLGATCSDTGGSFECLCSDGLEVSVTEDCPAVSIKSCTPPPCGEGAKCYNWENSKGETGAECECGYQNRIDFGELCDTSEIEVRRLQSEVFHRYKFV